MRGFFIGAVALAITSPALAHAYKIVLDKPANGKLLVGHAGVQAADDRTAATLVRLVAPGNELDQRGTIRVLVMNLSDKPFTFGPDNVTLKLGDGTVFAPTSVDKMENRRVFVETESRHAAAVDMINRGNFEASSGASTGGSGMSASSAGTGSAAAASGQNARADSDLLPGAATLNAIYQILVPLEVAPQKAWGGYYVFDVPKDVRKRKADQPLTIIVRTGTETHVFSGTLRWK